MMLTRSRVPTWIWLAVTLAVLPTLAALCLERAAQALPAKTRLFDAPSQAAEFIGYSRSILLTPPQQKLRDQVLGSMAAPCCKAYSQATCCCPCNLANSVSGLSNYLIVREHISADRLGGTVRDWLGFTNPKGFSGDVCDTAGGCARKFSENGCGGMDERDLRAVR
jgi:hypothetical protein